VDVALPLFQELEAPYGNKSVLCLTWDVQQQIDGTFEDTRLNVPDIDGMTNLKLFPLG
jgi:hypothetical protein